MNPRHLQETFSRRRSAQTLSGLALAASMLILVFGWSAVDGRPQGPLLRQLQDLESGFVPQLPSSNPPDLERELEAMLPGVTVSDLTGPRVVETLNRFFFGTLGLHGSQNVKDPDNLLPTSVLKRRQGYCVGIAALYLVLAERLDLPIHAVATPSHVFLRYDDGTTRINMETLQGGASLSDEQYIREQRIPEESIRRGVFMRNLSTEEFLAQVHNNLGVIYSERREYAAAETEYRTALYLDPRLPAASYNWGNDLLRETLYRKAVRRFSKSLQLYPTDVWALNNRGLAYLKMGKPEKARRDFEEALRIDPGFEQARRNLKNSPGRSESP